MSMRRCGCYLKRRLICNNTKSAPSERTMRHRKIKCFRLDIPLTCRRNYYHHRRNLHRRRSRSKHMKERVGCKLLDKVDKDSTFNDDCVIERMALVEDQPDL